MNDFIKLSIDLTYNIYLENNIENFDNYNSSITCFIFNLFLSIQNSGIIYKNNFYDYSIRY